MPAKYTDSRTPHVCQHCSKSFMAYPRAKRVVCSQACHWARRRHERNGSCQRCGVALDQEGKYYCRTCRYLPIRVVHERTCPVCQTTFTCQPSAEKVYCSLTCARKMSPQCQKRPDLRPTSVCEKCGNTFRVQRKESVGRFCSRKCSDAVSKNPPAFRVDKHCLHCGTPFRAVPRTDGREKACCSPKCSKVHRAKTVHGPNHPLWKPKTPMACEICGTVVEVTPSKVKRFRACSRRCAVLIGLRQWPRPSSIERKMDEAFRVLSLRAHPQYIFGPYAADFAFPEHRVIVECDGKYWHSLPDRMEKDRSKDAYLIRHKWLVVRLTEDEINASPSSCAERVANLLHDRTPGLP